MLFGDKQKLTCPLLEVDARARPPRPAKVARCLFMIFQVLICLGNLISSVQITNDLTTFSPDTLAMRMKVGIKKFGDTSAILSKDSKGDRRRSRVFSVAKLARGNTRRRNKIDGNKLDKLIRPSPSRARLFGHDHLFPDRSVSESPFSLGSTTSDGSEGDAEESMSLFEANVEELAIPRAQETNFSEKILQLNYFKYFRMGDVRLRVSAAGYD